MFKKCTLNITFILSFILNLIPTLFEKLKKKARVIKKLFTIKKTYLYLDCYARTH